MLVKSRKAYTPYLKGAHTPITEYQANNISGGSALERHLLAMKLSPDINRMW